MERAAHPPARRAVPRLVLAGLLLAMAAGQLSNPGGFVDIVASYDLGGTAVARVGAAALITGELIAAVGLVSRDTSRRHRATSVALAVALTWSLLAAQAFARGLTLDNCGCFGVHLAQPLRWWILVEDLEFVALAWWVRARHATVAAPYSPRAGAPERPRVS